MSDPASVAGTAVGVISLGIQVCQGLVDYYRAWEGQAEETKVTMENIAHEQQILELLQSTLAKQPSSFAASVTEVEACVIQANAEIVKLDELLQKCRRTPIPSDFREKVKNATKSLLYPFKKETIRDLKNSVAEVGQILASAIQLLQLEMSDNQRQSLLTLRHAASDHMNDLNFIKTTTSEITDNVEVVDQKLAGIQMTNARLECSMTTVQSAVRGFQSKLDEVSITMQNSAMTLPGLQRNEEFLLSRVDEGFRATQSGVQDLAQQVKMMQLALISKPGLQRDVCDRVQVFSDAGEQELHSERFSNVSQRRAAAHLRRQNLFCTCTARKTSRLRSLLPSPYIKLFCSTRINERHRENCPFYSLTRTRNDAIGFRVDWPTPFLASALELSFCLTRGAGGTAISPMLVYRPVVPENAPAFLLFEKDTLMSKGVLLYGPVKPTPYLSSYLEFALRELLNLFKEQKASPYDITQSGDTLLMAACSLASDVDCDSYDSFRNLLRGLIEVGVPLNEINYDWTALDLLVSRSVVHGKPSPFLFALADELGSLGMEYHDAFGESLNLVDGLPSRYRYMSHTWVYNDTLDPSNLGAAVLERSGSRIRQILNRSPKSMFKLNRNGESVLHLCCGWPEGMAILLQLGANPLISQGRKGRFDRKVGGFLPLHYAVACDCLETVSLLLQNDSPIFGEEDIEPNLDMAFFNENIEIINILIEALANRRRRLQDLATRSLPPMALHELNLDPNLLVDQKAYLLRKALFDNRIEIPPALVVSPWATTIYHRTCMTTEIAERLYDLGFQDVNGRDSLDETPLATTFFLSWDLSQDSVKNIKARLTYAAWLVSKEPEALRCIQGMKPGGVRNTAAHDFLYSLGMVMGWLITPASIPAFMSGLDLASVSSNMLRMVLAADWTDDCACVCSKRGCLPYVSMLKGLSYNRGPRTRQSPSEMQWHLSIIKWLYSCQDPGFPVSASVWADMVRLETFNALGLTYVCCCNCWNGSEGIDDLEAKEIREEGADMVHRLETLMSEFEDELSQERQSMVTFFEGYWERRMSEVLSGQEQTRLQPEEYTGLREIGIVLDSDPESSSPALTNLGLEEETSAHADTPIAVDDDSNHGKDGDFEVSSDLDDEFFEVDEGFNP